MKTPKKQKTQQKKKKKKKEKNKKKKPKKTPKGEKSALCILRGGEGEEMGRSFRGKKDGLAFKRSQTKKRISAEGRSRAKQKGEDRCFFWKGGQEGGGGNVCC